MIEKQYKGDKITERQAREEMEEREER